MPEQPVSENNFDVIVIGVGSMGAPACYYLAKRGYKVLGLEQFDITHELGSHAGQSRIIRKAYFEHPAYVPLLNRAYDNWKQLEQETGEQVYHETGVVYFGQPDQEIIRGVKLSAGLHHVPVEEVDASTSGQRFNRFHLPTGFETIFEPGAGFITPEKAILLYAGQAVKHGCSIHVREKAITWQKDGNSIIVKTNADVYRCSKLIITAGAWAGNLVPGIAGKIKITRQFVAWIKPANPADFFLHNFPCWLIDDDERPGCYYGFPVLPQDTFGEPYGLKIACHYPGSVTDADDVDRRTGESDIEDIRYALDKYLPGTFESMVTAKTCLYANLPDENFVIDKLPGFEKRVIVACGFSGHGFKFASVVGEILADLAINGSTSLPIDFLNIKRFM